MVFFSSQSLSHFYIGYIFQNSDLPFVYRSQNMVPKLDAFVFVYLIFPSSNHFFLLNLIVLYFILFL